jgi:TatD DNase family protein
LFTDTHTHAYLPEFDADRDTMIERALGKMVNKLFLPNIDTGTFEPMLALCSKYPNVCFPMAGLHPCSVTADYLSQLEEIKEQFTRHKFYAIGEIGIDLYHDVTFAQQQKEAFRIQLNWSREMNLPVVIHCRNSFDEVMEIVKEEKPKGIFHCFTGTKEEAIRIMELKTFKMGIGGVVTYKNSTLPQVLKEIPLSYLVLETDSPYLSPVPYRGKRNESSYIPIIAEKLAEIYKLPVEKIAEQTTENSAEIFGI